MLTGLGMPRYLSSTGRAQRCWYSLQCPYRVWYGRRRLAWWFTRTRRRTDGTLSCEEQALRVRYRRLHTLAGDAQGLASSLLQYGLVSAKHSLSVE